MEKYRMIFYDECVAMDQTKFDREDVFGYVKQQRYHSNFTNVKVSRGKDFDKYTMISDNSIMEIVFPIQCFHANKKYINILNAWHKYDLKRNLMILGCILALTGSAVALSNKNVTEKIADYKFRLENLKEMNDIKNLEKEILAHSGYGEVDGYKQSIKDHEQSYCHLGKNVTLENVEDSIMQYCITNGLGEEVGYAACDKYEYLLQGDAPSAFKIELASEYKEAKEKVNTLK